MGVHNKHVLLIQDSVCWDQTPHTPHRLNCSTHGSKIAVAGIKRAMSFHRNGLGTRPVRGLYVFGLQGIDLLPVTWPQSMSRRLQKKFSFAFACTNTEHIFCHHYLFFILQVLMKSEPFHHNPDLQDAVLISHLGKLYMPIFVS